MLKRLTSIKLLSHATLVCLALFLFASCVQEQNYEGIYQAEGGKTQKYCNSQIELMEKGMAVWRVPDDEVSFRWDIKRDEIWLSTKSGGIIIGKITDDTIKVKLPGTKTVCYFKKTPIE